jgi:hypothetical protein
MKQIDIEDLAERTYRDVGYELTEAVSPIELASAVFADGRRPVVFEVDNQDDEVLVTRTGRRTRIVLRAEASDLARSWLVAREIAKHVLGNDGVFAERLAACLRAPRGVVQRITRAGAALPQLADECLISESSAVLRYGEALDLPVALVVPGAPIRMRGRRGSRPPRLRRLRLTDDPSRYALVPHRLAAFSALA